MHLSTHRLLIRPRTADDLHDLQRLHRNPLVMRYARSREDAQTLDRKFRRSLERSFPQGHSHWTLLRKGTTETFIGSAMLIAFEDDPLALEAGWRLEPKAWGHGYAREALNAIFAHGLSIPGIARIVAFIHRDNHRSQKLATRLGFVPTTIESESHGLYEKFSGAAGPNLR